MIEDNSIALAVMGKGMDMLYRLENQSLFSKAPGPLVQRGSLCLPSGEKN